MILLSCSSPAKRPVVEALPAGAHRLVGRLVGGGHEAVERDADVEDHLGHSDSFHDRACSLPSGGPRVITSGIGFDASGGGSPPVMRAAMRSKYRSNPALG